MKLLKMCVYVPMMAAVLVWFAFGVHGAQLIPPHLTPCPVYKHAKITKYPLTYLPANEELRIVKRRRGGWVKVDPAYPGLATGWTKQACMDQWSMKPSSN